MNTDDDQNVLIVSLGDGTWVELDELPTVMWFTRKEVDTMDKAPTDCTNLDHIHIQDLIKKSHWNDTCESIRETAKR